MTKPYRLRFAFPVAFALAALTVSCGGDVTLPGEGEAADLEILDGNTQVGPAGAALAAPVRVRVLDSDEQPVANQSVTFVIETGGGSVEPGTVTTGADGIAAATWTLGAAAGGQSLRARTQRGGGSDLLEVQFTATAVAGSGSMLVGVTGDDQLGPVNSALADSLVVKATDAFGNPVANVEVTWSVSGGGSISPVTVVTGADGLAAAERVLGPTAGPQSAQATVEGFTGSPVTFSHTAQPANPTALVLVSGDDQVAPAGFEVAGDLVVRLEDPNGNGIGGRPITWVVPAGSGSVDPINATTNANGLATTRWTLPATVGGHTVSAVFSGLPPVVFSATATADAPAEIEMVSGNGQSAAVGTALPSPLVVRVTDAGGNPVSGVSVAWTAAGGGTVDGGATANTATNAQGLAQVTRVLGLTPGQYSTTAAVDGLQGSPITFVSTATVGPPAQLALLQAPGSPIVSGSAFQPAPIIQVQDAQGNAVPQGGIPIVVTIAAGTGQPGASLENDTRNTNVNGRVTFSTLRLSGAPDDDYVLTFTAVFSGVPLTPVSSGPIVVTAGGAARLVITTQPSTNAQSGVPFAQQPVIQVQDATGNPITGERTITASIGDGGGTLGGDVTASTGGGSTATFTDLEISGTIGSRTLIFSSGALTPAESNPINLAVGPPADMDIQAGNNQTAEPGEALPIDPAVIIRDSGGNPVSGVEVTFAITGGSGGDVSPATASTNAQGIAATSWTLGPSEGEYELTATSAAGAVTFDATAAVVIGPPTQMDAQAGDDQTAPVGATLPTNPAVLVRDGGGNPVSGVEVTFTITGGTGGSVTPGTASTNGSGVASTSWTLGPTAGAYELTATSVAGTVVFSATATAQGTTTTLEAAPPSPAPSGTTVTLTATVTSGGGTPTGTVEFRDGGTPIGSDDLAGGTAAIDVPLADGAHSITAHYLGNGTFAPSASSAVPYEIAAANTPPTANPDFGLTVDEDGTLARAAPGVLANDSDADGDDLTAAQVPPGPSRGEVALNADGSFTYVPDPDFNGTDQFTYRANDGQANSGTATVTIAVRPVNDVPVFTPGGDISITTAEALDFDQEWATGIDPGPPDESQDVNFSVSLVNPADEDAFLNPPQISDDGTLSFNAVQLTLLTDRVIPVRVVATDGDGGSSDEVVFTLTITPNPGP